MRQLKTFHFLTIFLFLNVGMLTAQIPASGLSLIKESGLNVSKDSVLT